MIAKNVKVERLADGIILKRGKWTVNPSHEHLKLFQDCLNTEAKRQEHKKAQSDKVEAILRIICNMPTTERE